MQPDVQMGNGGPETRLRSHKPVTQETGAHYLPLPSPVFGPCGAPSSEPLGALGVCRQTEAGREAAPQHPLPCSACSGPVPKSCDYFLQFPFCNPFKKTQAQPKQGAPVGSMFPAANRIFRSPGLLCPPRDFCWVGVGQARGCGTAPTHNVPAASSAA